MAEVKKIPYYTMKRSIFRGKVWKKNDGLEGAIPINTSQKISYDRCAPGQVVLKPTERSKKQLIAQKTEAEGKRSLTEVKSNKPSSGETKPSKPYTLESDAEDKEKLPKFDLQDVPLAMDKIGWPTAAKIARRWFANPKHIYNDQPNSVQPIDDTTVTLKWALKYGSVAEKFNELVEEKIYSEKAIAGAKQKILKHVKNKFDDSSSAANLSFDTSPWIRDIRQFHIDWQIQFQAISTRNTLDGLSLTDLTATLGNFNIYAAIGMVEVAVEKFYRYDDKGRTKTFCAEATATITSVYTYLKDNYSFNDKNDGNSQYLGHWNKNDMILSYSAVVSDLVDGKKIHTNMGSAPIAETKVNWDYLPGGQIDKPVDKRTGVVRKFMEKDVYWPVYNSSYSEWREKHGRGGDFMIYSRPEIHKLKKPIIIKLDTLCKPPEPM
ncbi:DUF6402 family protein [Pseudomonas cerasi]|uniref:DUF6402 family protein n=1 Tax=Pseudomonas cerasi TaxID=1583341 RepID=UPI0022FFF6E1|nr:DUF6402 family protein [Pseudomonas cerasi]MDA7014167.1 DUF6402 family protein [Pseudomonas cerasi]